MSAASGRAAQAAGDAWEAWVEAQYEMSYHLGILAWVEHNEPHYKKVDGKFVPVKPGVADHTGVMRGARTYAAECKSVLGDRLPKARIEPRQAQHMSAVAAAGGLALLLVEFRVEPGRPDRVAIPWSDVLWSVARTAESLTLADARPWLISLPRDLGKCFLSRWCEGGPRIGEGWFRKRAFARE